MMDAPHGRMTGMLAIAAGIALASAALPFVRVLARAGVIDHVVATPVRLWVITATDWRVSREELLHILAATADNTTAVWDWAPPGTPVRGCLVAHWRTAPSPHPVRLRQGAGRGAHPRDARARAQGRVPALTRAPRTHRRRGRQALTGVRIARVLDVTSTCGPRRRFRAPASNSPARNRPTSRGKPQPDPLSRANKGLPPPANTISCARACQPSTTCERSRPRVRSPGPDPRGAGSGRVRARAGEGLAAGAVRNLNRARGRRCRAGSRIAPRGRIRPDRRRSRPCSAPASAPPGSTR